MLEEVVVSNLGLISNATLTPSAGLTVITGETGAGKTAMLGALRLLIGESAPKGLIGPHADSADVSARFVATIEHVARRTITPGRSKAYLDGAIGTASALRETIGPMVSIVGQHDQHTITSTDGVRRLLDASFTKSERKDVDAYADTWADYETIRDEADLLGTDQRHLARELETIRFQIAEIADAGFELGDDELLRGRAIKLRHADELATAIDVAIERLGDRGASAAIEQGARAISGAAGLDANLADLHDQISVLVTMLSDVNVEIVRYAADLEVEPSLLEDTEQRVALLASLKRKYGDSLESIIGFLKDAETREEELASLLASADGINERLETMASSLRLAGDALRSTRRKAADRIATTAVSHLKDLGFNAPLIEISVTASEPTRSGSDTVTVLFASDSSLSPEPVASIASGGELSRLVLALTLASGGVETDVVAFDEIDAGVGGETALAMGRKLASLASTRQVLCVTHLPQVAAFADEHYVVRREGVSATIVAVTGDQRTEEVSRMLAGLSSSDKGKQHAEELLALASAEKAG
jgi:DNA repair protein RecN (Recombination protein N)